MFLKPVWTLSLLLVCGAPAWLLAEKPRLESVEAWVEQGHPLEEVARLRFPSGLDTGHPQGMIVHGDKIFLSTSLNERYFGKLRCKASKLMRLRLKGAVLDFEKENTLNLNERGECHLGGLVADSTFSRLISPFAQHSARSSSSIMSFDPQSLAVQESLQISDHLGSLLLGNDGLYAFSWDARKIYSVSGCKKASECRPQAIEENHARSAAYQDCKVLQSKSSSPTHALCSAVGLYPWRWNLMGFLRWDLWWEKKQLWEWPVEVERNGYLDWIKVDASGTHLVSRLQMPKIDGIYLSRNPMAVVEEREGAQSRLRFYFAPQDYPQTQLIILQSPLLKNGG
jgi:hypothetical protein